tara:strand:+ start:1128 stop:2246 length:1119 start_codon:yes stop_codon:yes gene_type:complete
MQIKEFSLERIQSLYENLVELNLSDSGVHPYRLDELLNEQQTKELLSLELGYGWTNGSTELRERIAALYVDRTADNVIVTNGSAEANFLMVMSLLEPGDEIIVIVPNYMQIAGWAESIGVKVVEVPLDGARDWLPDLVKLESVVTSKTKMITICHPNNPTGSTLPLDEINKLANFAKKHDLYLHADEVYKGAEFDGNELPSFADVYEKSIITCGLSKAMAMPGLRIGWLVGLSEDIYKSWQRKDYTSITTGAVSEYVATIVLEPAFRTKVLQRSKDYLKSNLALLTNWVEENQNWISFIPPKAGGMAFLKYDLDINSTELAHIFRTELGVLILPGDVYGLDGYFRVGIGAPTDHLDEGLKRISAYVKIHYAK